MKARTKNPLPKGAKFSRHPARWALGALLLVFVGTGVAGVNFGMHWDEFNHFNGVSRSIRKSLIVPTWHIYPGMVYWLTYLPSVFDGAQRAIASFGDATDNREARATYVQSPAYNQIVRTLFVLVSSLALIWIFLAASRCWRGDVWGLVAAALLGGSWEFAYHARWVATDAIHCQFIALSLLGMLIATSRKKPLFWVGFAAAASGLAMATKYTGALSLLPVLALVRLHPTWKPQGRELWKALGVVGGVFVAAYLIGSPAILFYPEEVIHDVSHAGKFYASDFMGYTAEPGFVHGEVIVRYLVTEALSSWPLLAVALFLLVPVGLTASWKENRSRTVLLSIFPVTYFCFFSAHRVVAVRNYLVLLPYVVLFAAGGAAALWGTLSRGRWRNVYAAAAVGVFLVNAAWLGWTTYTIVYPEGAVDRAVAYLESQPEKRFLVGRKALSMLRGRQPANVVTDPRAPFDEVLVESHDLEGRGLLPATGDRVFLRNFGPIAVNFHHYPEWNGRSALLILPKHKFMQYRLQLAGTKP